MKEDIPKELVVGKLEQVDIACGYMARNFQNYSTRKALVGLEDNVGPNLEKLDGETIFVVLDCGDL